ncbi:MAG: SpoIIE family protein phosphatase [Bacteroidales bacterium]|nr:SpoIIE family protein phosphatase [Bacteroidales bacterium]MBP5682124.1 SpoIIE family protein phosphatase [Bacteroidales bacterium]
MQNTIVTIAAIAVLITVCIVMYIRNKRRTEALWKTIDECKKETKSAQEAAVQTKENCEQVVKEYNALNQSGLHIIKHKKQKEIYNTTYEAIRKFIHTDSIGIGILNGLYNSLDFSFFNIESETIPFARYNLDICNNINIYCFTTGKIVLLNDYQKEVSNYLDTEKYKVSKTITGSALYIPLYDDDIIFGVLSIFNNEPHYFNEYRTNIVRSIVSYLETAIVNFSTARTSDRQNKQYIAHRLELEHTLSELRKSQSELLKISTALRNTDNAVMLLDGNGDITWINNSFTKVYGFTLEEYTHISTHYEDALRQKDAIEFYKFVYDNAKSVTFTLPHITKSGDEVWVQTTLSPTLDEQGNILQVVAVDTDITSLKKAELEIVKQRNEIELKNKDVTKSIEYASTIQQALMTGQGYLRQRFKKSFLINLPKDIVSGDFFWMGDKFGRKYMALCDCEGHGVPGAFVSMMGKVFLDEILQGCRIEDPPSTILMNLNDKLQEAVNSLSSKVGGIDGMDMSFCIINSRNTQVQYAGAYRPLYIVRKGELTTIMPDKVSIGGISPDENFQFEDHWLQLEDGDFLLVCSDGYADQFGSEFGKKLGRRNFSNLIIEASKMESADDMAKFLYDKHIEWRGNLEQVDDISIVGIAITQGDDEDEEDDE